MVQLIFIRVLQTCGISFQSQKDMIVNQNSNTNHYDPKELCEKILKD